MYPFRTDDQDKALNSTQHSPYATDDHPFLNTMRYSLSGYEPHHIQAKEKVDNQGIQDNLFWLKQTRQGRS